MESWMPFSLAVLVLLFVPHIVAFSASSTRSTANTDVITQPSTSTSTSFWETPSKVSSLPDPPNDSILQSILERPYRGGLEPIWDIPTYSPTITYGKLPSDLIGTLAANGPGRMRIQGRQFGHWFDGDGYVTSLVLNGATNEVSFTGRYVRTERYKLQQELEDKLQGQNSNYMHDENNDEKPSPPLAFAGFWTKRGTGKWYENLVAIPQNPANTATMWLPPKPSSKTKNDDHGNENRSSPPPPPPRLYALCEGGNPIELDPYTLETMGVETPFERQNENVRDGDTSMSFFSAHFSKCPTTQKIYNHGTILNPMGRNDLKLYQMDQYGTIIQERTTELSYGTTLHDAAISNKYMMYISCPWVERDDGMIQMLTGRESLGNMYEWDSKKGTIVYVHHLEDLRLKYKIRLPNATSMYHLVDVYDESISIGGRDVEDGEGEGEGSSSDTSTTHNSEENEEVFYIRVAELENNDRTKLEEQFGNLYQNANPNERQLRTKLREYKIRCTVGEEPIVTDCDIGSVRTPEPGTASGQSRQAPAATPSSAVALCEFPVVNAAWDPQARNRYCWTNAASSESTLWIDGIQKVDMITGECSDVKTFGDGNYACAPAFVAKDRENSRGEDDGYIIVNVYCSNEHRTDVVVLDAKSLDMLCRIELAHHIPYQFHGDFLPGFTGKM